MKKFIKHMMLIFFGLIVILLFLDFSFTTVYENSEPRTKFQYLRSLKNKKVDYIFLGSSRVENSIVSKLIRDKTGKSAINLGFQASKMSDIYTVLKLIKKYNIKTDKILIQVDYIFNIEDGCSNILQYELMPFIRENEVTQEYFNRCLINKKEILYTPFYRYLHYEPKIGFREFFLNLINKKTSIVKNNGFVPLQGNSFEHNNSLPSQIISKNKYFDGIKTFAEINKMPVIFFCVPFCKHTKNLIFIKKLKQKIPELYDFSGVINNDKMFKNCSHLNQNGANDFTKYLIEKMLIDK
ncbi:hypothetical protein E0I61_13125 [Flavobacterium ranwuense]|uniref:DUF1574 domain-containing protein n=1 Tax=Flavobacterium ranwuense TaxID=2541725 RepID=A0ABY2DPC7_9FLAO|nr:hypothetical protein [Flavobacterium ranwuense]TDE28037.1 hypothetical protein E0I61_13125 [Flavobacterium ranwuense]